MPRDLFENWTRRDALIRTAAATFAATGASTPGVVFAQAVGGGTSVKSPGMTEGPYWLDAMPQRSDVRPNTGTGGGTQTGLELRLGFSVMRLGGGAVTPVSGARVDLWHANWQGRYSGFAAEGTAGQNFLRGYQTTNAHGVAKFLSVYPGWYSGRAVHMHYRVRTYSGTTVASNFVSQLFFNESVTDLVYARAPYATRGVRNVTNATDGIYQAAAAGYTGDVGDYCLLRLDQNATRAVASFNVVI